MPRKSYGILLYLLPAEESTATYDQDVLVNTWQTNSVGEINPSKRRRTSESRMRNNLTYGLMRVIPCKLKEHIWPEMAVKVKPSWCHGNMHCEA